MMVPTTQTQPGIPDSSTTTGDGAAGLIEDRFINTKSKVPLLGDLPFLGALFRSEGRERRRTNLIVFLRPIVMRDADSANRFSVDRYEQIRGRQESAQPQPSFVLPVGDAAVLPSDPKGVVAPLATEGTRAVPAAPPPPGALPPTAP
jgi:general secretion pathway protein D